MSREDELLARLEDWLSKQQGRVDLHLVQQTGDADLIGAYLLKAFREAARKAVLCRMEREAEARFPESAAEASPVARIFLELARAWSLTKEEQVALLGRESQGDLAVVLAAPAADLPVEVIERVAILLDIFQAINILLPVSSAANGWIRRANDAPSYGGGPALEKMMGEGLAGLRAVRSHLWAELCR